MSSLLVVLFNLFAVIDSFSFFDLNDNLLRLMVIVNKVKAE